MNTAIFGPDGNTEFRTAAIKAKIYFLPAQYEILLKFRRYFMLVAIATNVVKIFIQRKHLHNCYK